MTTLPPHQVLAGAGPAVAAVPLVVVWAGGSAVNLVQGISRGQVGIGGTAARIGFVSGQSVAQVCACQQLSDLTSLRSKFRPGVPAARLIAICFNF